MILCRGEGIRRAEARARDLLSMSEDLQMERASLGAFAWLATVVRPETETVILCGPGANGGDGLALARHARLPGWDPIVCFPDRQPRQSTTAALQRDRYRALGGREESWSKLRERQAVQVVDALFGTGLSRPLDGIWHEVCAWARHGSVFALDLPSGTDPDTGHAKGARMEARWTATFGRAKAGLLLQAGRESAGEVRVVDIGIPASCWDGEDAVEVLDLAWGRSRLPPRERSAHKGQAGRLLCLCGSDEFFGAAVLCASAALRSGTGMLQVGSTRSVANRIAEVVPEAMGAVLVGQEVDPSQWGRRLERVDAVVAGPGLGTSPDAATALRRLFEGRATPLVLDADGLNLCAADPTLREALGRRAGEAALVVTPHPGEAARLLGWSVGQLLSDPLLAAGELARSLGAVAVFKGATPVVAAPDGRMALGVLGHPGMAVGGMGDCLAGAIGARLAEGEEPFEATCQAVHAHARAGELAGEAGRRGMSVVDLVSCLPAAWEAMERRTT